MNKAILAGQRLRTVLRMPEYEDTIGAWLSDARAAALHAMSQAKEPNEMFTAQGQYRAITQIFDLIERAIAAEEAALARQDKQINEAK